MFRETDVQPCSEASNPNRGTHRRKNERQRRDIRCIGLQFSTSRTNEDLSFPRLYKQFRNYVIIASAEYKQ
jgi:hypothetical protein